MKLYMSIRAIGAQRSKTLFCGCCNGGCHGNQKYQKVNEKMAK
jgi:hypothetical protein